MKEIDYAPVAVDTYDRFAALITLSERLDDEALVGAGVLPWGSPVPAFGDLLNSRVATVGINPSTREFVDETGRELSGQSRRFHTLSSLQLNSWSEVDARHLELMLSSYDLYFSENPYERWFNRLNAIVVGANASYYDPSQPACHLDIVPFATGKKWSNLDRWQRSALLEAAGNSLALTLRSSLADTLILNGSTVVKAFQRMAGIRLQEDAVPSWALARKSTTDVNGLAYRGQIDSLAGVNLRRNILVLGFNHNLQSSFGVSTQIVVAIRDWVAEITAGLRW